MDEPSITRLMAGIAELEIAQFWRTSDLRLESQPSSGHGVSGRLKPAILRIEICTAHQLRIGTDDAENLATFLRNKVGE